MWGGRRARGVDDADVGEGGGGAVVADADHLAVHREDAGEAAGVGGERGCACGEGGASYCFVLVGAPVGEKQERRKRGAGSRAWECMHWDDLVSAGGAEGGAGSGAHVVSVPRPSGRRSPIGLCAAGCGAPAAPGLAATPCCFEPFPAPMICGGGGDGG